jgi:NADH-quinone oxidoreductase subunit A
MIAGWQPVKAFTTLVRTMSSFLRSYLTVAIFAGAAVLLVTLMLGLGGLLRPKRPQPQKYIAYESGVDPVGEGWSQSQIRYYVFALLFVMFDVETVFIFPWAVKVQALGVFGLVEAATFILILALGLVYAWRKGVLRWV